MILLVSYDLNAPSKNYEELYKLFKTSSSWWHYLDSTWLLYTQDSISTWCDNIRKVIDENDHFIVLDVTKQPRNGWLPKKAWAWIKEHEKM